MLRDAVCLCALPFFDTYAAATATAIWYALVYARLRLCAYTVPA
jgi:hypothetical protein